MKSSLWATARTLVSNEVILVPLGEETPYERGHQRGVPPSLEVVILPLLAHLAWKRLQIDTDLAYHNKHCRRAFQWYQHRSPWRTLNPKNRGFSEAKLCLFSISGLSDNQTKRQRLREGQTSRQTDKRAYTVRNTDIHHGYALRRWSEQEQDRM